MKTRRTTGWKKMVNAIFKTANSAFFQKELRSLRSKYEIPVDGFDLTKQDDLYSTCTSYSSVQWKHTYKPKKELDEVTREAWIQRSKAIEFDLRELCKRVSLHYYGFIELMVPFLFFRQITRKQFVELANFHDSHIDTCYSMGANSLIEKGRWWGSVQSDSSIEDKDNSDAKSEYEFALENANQFPIAVLVGRYASLEDTLDFIRKNWKGIQESVWRDNKYGSGIVQARTRTTWDRNEFIWQHREKPRAEIAQLVNKKFGSMIDPIYIRNIISRERKRRGLKRTTKS